MVNSLLIFLLLIQTFQQADVYFTKEISSHKMVEMLQKLNLNLQGNVGLKIHSGETNGKYFLRPDFLQEIYEYTKGTFIESNVAYSSRRSSSQGHKELLEENGWSKNNRRVVILDENPDLEEINCPLSLYERTSEIYLDALSELGITINVIESRGRPKKYDDDLKDVINEMIGSGLSVKTIASRLNIDTKTVYYLKKDKLKQ